MPDLDEDVTEPRETSTPAQWRAQNPQAFGFARTLRPRGKVLPEHARGHNRALVLQTVYHAGPMSRADLARRTGLTRVTISDLVSDLVDEGIVVEQGVRPRSGPGKPAIVLDIDRVGHPVIGIDLSRPGVFSGALMTLDADVLERIEIDRPDDPDAARAAVQDLAAQLLAGSAAPVLGVGVGTPGIIRPDGRVLNSPNLGWRDVPLQEELAQALGLPVVVRNDANAALLAEYTFDGAASDTMLVAVGRGVGAAVLASGRLLTGSRFAAGEIGHVVVGTDGGPRCACGKHGCLEAWLNAVLLRERFAAAPDAATRRQVSQDAGERLAIAIAPIVAALDLSEIILAGPADILEDDLLHALRDTILARTIDGVFDDLRVRAAVQDDLVLRGAAVMVLSTQLGVS